MKRFAFLTATASLFAVAGFAETLSGTLVDVMCKDKDAAAHTTKCALGCSKSGFGLVTNDGKFVKFDDRIVVIEPASRLVVAMIPRYKLLP